MTPLQQKLAEAFALHQAGDIAAAAPLYRAVLAEDPDQPDALHMMGVIAQQKGNTQLGLQLMDAALANKPDMALAWYNRSLLLRVMKQPEEALESAKRAIATDGNLTDAFDMAGAILREMGKLQEAATFHARAVELQPDNSRYRSNYAVLLMAMDDLPRGYKTITTGKNFESETAAFALGNILRSAGYVGHALPHYRTASRLIPDAADVCLNEAMALLLVGELERGFGIWKELPDDKEELRAIPKWNGTSVGHLLLHEEQGLGDALQCVRYIPLVRERAQKITLRLSKSLQKLMQANFPDIDVITLEDPVPSVDARAQLMRLPAFFGTTLDSIPADVPYLRAKDEWRLPWHDRFSGLKKPRFGIVWAGNPGHRNNRNRSLTLEKLRPVLEAGRGYGVSLQKWERKDESALASNGLYDADPYLNDFAATAGAIMELDLVITVDTSVAHLAGALGKPVWLLVPFDPDWRWLLGREDSPWYPHMKLFRQEAPQNWSAPLTRMAGELAEFIGGDKSVLAPRRWTSAPLRINPFAVALPGFDPGSKA